MLVLVEVWALEHKFVKEELYRTVRCAEELIIIIIIINRWYTYDIM